MARQRPTESRKARVARATRQYATAQSIKAAQGPCVIEATLPISRETILMRRIDLAHVIGTGIWPEPLTQAVRRLMVDGSGEWVRDTEKIERNLQASAAIARASVIVPPPALIAGEIEVDDITADMCKPLFVEADPDEDQVILLAPGDEDRPDGVRLHTLDLTFIATRVFILVPGAMAAFRSGSGDPLASMEQETEDGEADE